MDLIRIALLRSLATLGRGKILWEMFWPLLAAGLVWIAALALAWEPLTAWLAGWFDASPEGAQAGMLAMAGFFALKVLLVLGVLFARSWVASHPPKDDPGDYGDGGL